MRIFKFRPHDTHFPFLGSDFLVMNGAKCGIGTYKESSNEKGYQVMFRFFESFLDDCGPIIRNWMAVMGRLTVGVSLFALSQFGCASQPVQGTDRSIHHVSTLGKETNSAQGSQRQPAPPDNLATATNPALEHDGGNMAGPLTLDTLETLARENNPTFVQAQAQIEGERAKALQAGLYPNPRIGYMGEQIGVEGTAGEFQGGFIQQEIVTAGKLRLSREKRRYRRG